MSLKMMHLVFVTASVALALTLAVWCWVQFATVGTAGFLMGAVGGFGAVGLLVPYGLWVRRKLRGVGLW